MKKNILKLIVIFIIGMVGGIFANQIFWPYFIERPLFHQYNLGQGPVYVTEVKETYIQENTALVEAIEKAEKTVITVKTQTKTGKTLNGFGFIATSDGLMVTLAELVPQGSDFKFFIDDQPVSYQVLKRDLKENLALIKLSDSVLTTAGFARMERLNIGERVFLVGKKTANEGIVKSFDQDFIQTNILENNLLAGSPLFNIHGEILGINTIDSKGNVSAISILKIRQFIGI